MANIAEDDAPSRLPVVFRITPGERCTDWGTVWPALPGVGVQAEARENGYSIWPDSMSPSIVL